MYLTKLVLSLNTWYGFAFDCFEIRKKKEEEEGVGKKMVVKIVSIKPSSLSLLPPWGIQPSLQKKLILIFFVTLKKKEKKEDFYFEDYFSYNTWGIMDCLLRIILSVLNLFEAALVCAEIHFYFPHLFV